MRLTLPLARTLLLLGIAPLLAACLAEGRAGAVDECTASPPASAHTGQLLVASQEGIVSVIDLASGSVTRLETGGELHGAAVSPDGRWGVITDYGRRRRSEFPWRVFDGNTLLIIDMAERRLARRLTVGEHRGVHDVEFVPGAPSQIVVTAQGSREIITVDLATGTVIAAVDTRGEGTHSLAITADGRTVFGANEGEETLSRIDMATGRLSGHLTVGANPLGVAVTADGSEVWVGGRDGVLRVLDARTGRERARIEGMEFVDDLAMTPDGRHAVVLDARGGALRMIDVARRAERGRLAMPRPGKVTIAPDGRTAFVSLYQNAQVVVVDLGALCVVGRYAVGRNPDGMGWSAIVPSAGRR